MIAGYTENVLKHNGERIKLRNSYLTVFEGRDKKMTSSIPWTDLSSFILPEFDIIQDIRLVLLEARKLDLLIVLTKKGTISLMEMSAKKLVNIFNMRYTLDDCNFHSFGEGCVIHSGNKVVAFSFCI